MKVAEFTVHRKNMTNCFKDNNTKGKIRWATLRNYLYDATHRKPNDSAVPLVSAPQCWNIFCVHDTTRAAQSDEVVLEAVLDEIGEMLKSRHALGTVGKLGYEGLELIQSAQAFFDSKTFLPMGKKLLQAVRLGNNIQKQMLELYKDAKGIAAPTALTAEQQVDFASQIGFYMARSMICMITPSSAVIHLPADVAKVSNASISAIAHAITAASYRANGAPLSATDPEACVRFPPIGEDPDTNVKCGPDAAKIVKMGAYEDQPVQPAGILKTSVTWSSVAADRGESRERKAEPPRASSPSPQRYPTRSPSPSRDSRFGDRRDGRREERRGGGRRDDRRDHRQADNKRQRSPSPNREEKRTDRSSECTFCKEAGRVYKNHTHDTCFFNPRSPRFDSTRAEAWNRRQNDQSKR